MPIDRIIDAEIFSDAFLSKASGVYFVLMFFSLTPSTFYAIYINLLSPSTFPNMIFRLVSLPLPM